LVKSSISIGIVVGGKVVGGAVKLSTISSQNTKQPTTTAVPMTAPTTAPAGHAGPDTAHPIPAPATVFSPVGSVKVTGSFAVTGTPEADFVSNLQFLEAFQTLRYEPAETDLSAASFGP